MSSTASIRSVDFSDTPNLFIRRDPTRRNWEARERYNSAGQSMNSKAVRARARNKLKKINANGGEFDVLSPKPVEDWDLEELARGRPRNAAGTFAGPAPAFISRAIHEAATDRFKSAVKTEMGASTVTALTVINDILRNQDIDDKGKPIVSATTKLDASKFLMEHLLGKPTQRVEADISVKLQAILGTVMVQPDSTADDGRYSLSHLPGVTMPMAEAEVEDYDDDEDLG